MSPRFVLGWENVPCVTEVVNRSLKADCTDFNNSDNAGKCSFTIIRPDAWFPLDRNAIVESYDSSMF